MVNKHSNGSDNSKTEQTIKLKSEDDEDVKFSESRKSGFWNKSRVILAVILLICLTLFIIGIVLITTAVTRPQEDHTQEEEQFSAEFKRAGLLEFMTKMFKKKIELFQTYDPRPETIKKQTDTAMGLFDELNNMDVDVSKLKLREKKALEQAKHYLKHIFGRPFEANYYAGDWMLGPNTFCWQDVCSVLKYAGKFLINYIKDGNIEKSRKGLEDIGKGLDQYVENMKYGVRAGMVRSKIQCEGGLTTFKSNFLKISLNGEKGILDEEFVLNFHNKLKSKNKGSLPEGTDAVDNQLIQYIGKPISNLLNYIEKEYIKHCVPDYVSSGLASLPLNYVYIDGVKDTSQPTTKKLPTGELIYGKETYKLVMPYFTTNDMTPEEVHQLGWEVLESLHSELVEFAKNYTGQSSEDLAVKELKQKLNSSEMYFADSFPKEEYGKWAISNCTSEETAKKHCPKRWAAMSKWMKLSREVINLIESKITHLFYFTSDYKSVPSCPVQLALDFNEASGVQSYGSAGSACTKPASYFLPFWSNRPGRISDEWSVNSHEANPGHHLQVQGFIENFVDTGTDVISALDQRTYYTAFLEGWALYSESPLVAQDTDLYEPPEAQMFKCGMYQAQMWRALRLVVDTGLHFYGYDRKWAIDLFEKYAWMNGDIIEKEVTRYQSNFGQATAYMIGKLHIYKLRNYTQEKLGKEFDIRDFHYQVLSQGSSPLSYLQDHIEKYVECKQQPDGKGCDEIMSPPRKRKSKQKQTFDKYENLENLPFYSHPRHYY